MESTKQEPTPVDVRGPIFLSYRHFDGAPIVAPLAWLLRAGGVPVWRDQDDLPPGDTDDRLAQALSDGLSGGVLVITPDIVNSRVVRQIEAEQLIRLHQSDPRFQLLIANHVLDDSGKVDYGAPDRLLSRPMEELRGVDQRGTDEAELLRLVKSAISHRMTQHRGIVEQSEHFDLTVQTRNVPQVYDRTGAQLDIRVRPSTHERLPNPDGLRDLQRTLTLLPDAVVTAGAKRVRISGGAHLSVAYAIGAALPSSRVGWVTVVDQRDAEWLGTSEAGFAPSPLVKCTIRPATLAEGVAARVLAYVDLLPTRSDGAFDRFLENANATYGSVAVIQHATPQRLAPQSADSIVAEIAAHIRELSGANDNAEVDLLLRCPFPVAILLGRLSNTLRVRVFEWDDSKVRGRTSARYVPCLEIQASNPLGPVIDVLLPSSDAVRREGIVARLRQVVVGLFRSKNSS
ncbi:SAVED domain-containing protein [Microbacterium wangchenii]|uniref:SAVED domain-containing protein n=1 Tax=Microbacterium wangchenii TaxID=2541726 RepID=UPI0011C7CD0A|nr:SAVED domain-containing protein [Microbacterium wangchenii]TXK11142.1 SAVED domain-containing protein [Microbacterium wangchenii]